MESQTERLVAELAQVEAARVPTAATVYGQSGAVALAVAQSLLISCIGLLFLGAAGALARAARDARASTAASLSATDATVASTDAKTDAATTRTDAPTDARARTDALADAMAVATAARIQVPTDAVTNAPQPQHFAAPQIQATPKGHPPAVPSWGRYAALAAGAGAGLLVPYAAQAAAVQAQAADAAPTQAEAPATLIHAAPAPTDATPARTDATADAAMPMQPHADAATDARTDATVAPTDASPRTDAPTDAAPAIHAAAAEPIQLDAFPEALILTAADAAPGVTRNDDGARFLRVKAGIEAGRIKPTLRAIYAAEGASQEVARRYLVELEQAGVIERIGRGYALRAVASTMIPGAQA